MQLSLIPMFIRAEFADYRNMYGYGGSHAYGEKPKETLCKPAYA
jgi:hypothetical protein